VAWTRSGWHNSWFIAGLQAGSNHQLPHPVSASVFDNTATPDGGWQTVAWQGCPACCWNTGELTSPPGWPAGGVPVPNLTAVTAGDQVTITGGDVISPGPCTFTPSGDMLFDAQSSLPNPRMSLCFHWWGGPVPVGGGALTIRWAAAGIAALTTPLLAVTP
jgi:hypothetical protein